LCIATSGERMRQEGATAQKSESSCAACPSQLSCPTFTLSLAKISHLAASSSAHRSVSCSSQHHVPVMAPSNDLATFLSIFCKLCFPRVDNRHSTRQMHCSGGRISIKHTRTFTAYLRMKCVCGRLAWYADDGVLLPVRNIILAVKLAIIPCPIVGSLDSKRKYLPSPENPRHRSRSRF